MRPEYADGNWHEVGILLRQHGEAEKREWTPERDAIAELMSEGDERPSGISGLSKHEIEYECGCAATGTYHLLKSGWMAAGRRVLEIMAKRGLR